ncbi:hypothetical protein [Streptomyces sp. NPDC091416]|uniref:hypothetical protein n=1 Tax=Streptomyces sp. NPDC091416 TaxID=3366003 RepID=UPI00382849F9
MSSESHGPFGRVVLVGKETDDAFRSLLPNPRLRRGLPTFLCALVPLAIQEQSRMSAQRIDAMRTELIDMIAEHGDDLQFGGAHQTSARVALVQALAILATAEGGVTILGVHACTARHEGCPGSTSSAAGTDTSQAR